jgi:hypothetical protein
MQTKPSSGAGDQHDACGADPGHAEGRAHARADRARSKCRLRETDVFRNPDRVLRRHACELSVTAATLLTDDMAVVTKVMPPAEAMTTDPTGNALIDGNSLTDAFRRYSRSDGSDLAGDLVARRLVFACAPDQAGSDKQIVMADPSGRHANQHAVRARIRSLDGSDAKYVGATIIAQSYCLHQHVAAQCLSRARLLLRYRCRVP